MTAKKHLRGFDLFEQYKVDDPDVLQYEVKKTMNAGGVVWRADGPRRRRLTGEFLVESPFLSQWKGSHCLARPLAAGQM